jgi:hypothetical protein
MTEETDINHTKIEKHDFSKFYLYILNFNLGKAVLKPFLFNFKGLKKEF